MSKAIKYPAKEEKTTLIASLALVNSKKALKLCLIILSVDFDCDLYKLVAIDLIGRKVKTE